MITLERLPNARGPVFVYDGNGCQWETMGRELLNTAPVFADAIDRVDSLFQQHGDFSLRTELRGPERREALDLPKSLSQPCLSRSR